MHPLFSLYQFHYERLLFCDGKTRCSTLASQRAEVNSGIKNPVSPLGENPSVPLKGIEKQIVIKKIS